MTDESVSEGLGPLSEASKGALTGAKYNDYVYFKSDIPDGDLHAIAFGPEDVVSTWTVTRIDPDGTRLPAIYDVHTMFYAADFSVFSPPCWFADYWQAGTRLEFVLPEGVTFTVSASRNITPISRCDSVIIDPKDPDSVGVPCTIPAKWRVVFKGSALSECDHGLTNCNECEVVSLRCDECKDVALEAFGPKDACATAL